MKELEHLERNVLPPRKAAAIDLGEVKLKGKENAVRVWGMKG